MSEMDDVRREIQDLRLAILPILETAQQAQAAVQALLATICALIPAIPDRAKALAVLAEVADQFAPLYREVRAREVFDRTIQEVTRALLQDAP